MYSSQITSTRSSATVLRPTTSVTASFLKLRFILRTTTVITRTSKSFQRARNSKATNIAGRTSTATIYGYLCVLRLSVTEMEILLRSSVLSLILTVQRRVKNSLRKEQATTALRVFITVNPSSVPLITRSSLSMSARARWQFCSLTLMTSRFTTTNTATLQVIRY